MSFVLTAELIGITGILITMVGGLIKIDRRITRVETKMDIIYSDVHKKDK